MATISESRAPGDDTAAARESAEAWRARWPILQDLAGAALRELVLESSCKRFARHQTVFRQGETLRELYLVEHGSIKLTRTSESGKELIVRVAAAGDSLGAGAGSVESETLAEALQDATVLAVPVSTVSRAILGNPRFAITLLERAESLCRQAESATFRIAFDTVPARLVQTLIRFSEESSGELAIPLNQTELAHLIGSSRETVCSVLNRFRRNGLLSIDRGRVRILSRADLSRIR